MVEASLRNTTVSSSACVEGSCVLVLDSVRGGVFWCPQRCCSVGNRGSGLDIFCAVCGDGGVMRTTKLRQMDSSFGWEVYFPLRDSG